MTNQQAPEIYTLHTVPNKGERPWSGIYTVRADAEHDAKVMRDVTGRDWSVVRLVVADTAATPTGPIARYKIGSATDEWGQRSSTPSGIPDASGSWVRYADHVTALAGQAVVAPAQPAAQQGVAYAALPTSSYAGRVFEEGFLIGTCPLYTADQLHAFADRTHALRASHGQAPATAPADTVTAPAAYSGNIEQELAMLIRRIVSSARRNCEDGSNVLKLANEAWTYLVRKGLNGSPLRDAGIESDHTPPAQAADSVLEDAARLDWLAEYLVGTRTDLDDEIVASETVNDLRKLVKAAIKQGATQ